MNWINGVAKRGGVEFRTWKARGQTVLHCQVRQTLVRIDGAEYFDTEAEARAAAEEIAANIFKGEEVWKVVAENSTPAFTADPMCWPAHYKLQRGVWIRMEGTND